MKRGKTKDLEDMVYRLQLTYNEIEDILDVKHTAGSTEGYTVAPAIYEVTDFNMLLMSLLPKDVKVSIKIDDIRQKTNLTTNETIGFTKKSFFSTKYWIYSISFMAVRWFWRVCSIIIRYIQKC